PSPTASPTPAAIALYSAPQGQPGIALTTAGSTLLAITGNASNNAASATVTVGAAGAAVRQVTRLPGTAGGFALPPYTPATGRRVLQLANPPQVGSTAQFWVNDGGFVDAGDHRQTATLQRVSPHAYFYVDNASPLASSDLTALADTFDNTIYPKVTGAFGAEHEPGVDGADRIYVVVSPVIGQSNDVLAYFWARDAVPRGQGDAHSNHKAVLLVSSKVFGHAQVLEYGTIAHEFQHLINFSRKGPLLDYQSKEDRWLDEGMAMFAMDVAGYGLSQGEQITATGIRDFETNPSAYSLTDWENNPDQKAFGETYLFVRYLVDRDGLGVLPALIDSKLTGVANVDAVLHAHGDDFADFFRAWCVANAISGTPLAAGTPYQYQTVDLHGLYGPIQLPGFTMTSASGPVSVSLRPWGAAYYRFTAGVPQSWQLSATGNAPLVGAAIAP
ncbi:MAG TPA: hypothetical protein V6D47_11485, partial [Oscillatoriaceae cyanobacterium]